MYSDRKNLYSVGKKNIRICSKAKLVKQSKVSNPQRKKPKYKDLFIYFIFYIYIYIYFFFFLFMKSLQLSSTSKVFFFFFCDFVVASSVLH